MRQFFVAAALVSFANPGAAQNSARVDSLFDYLNRSTSPGLAVAVVQNGKLVFSKGYGFADIEHRVPITPSTVFNIASLSKQFTGFAIATLATEGRIKLSDDIRKYIPELQDFGKPITIDNLARQTSGIRDWPAALSVGGWRPDDPISQRQVLAFAYNQRTLNFDPGAEYRYSNTNYNILAELVQRVTGQSYASWVAAHVFKPLGMNSTRVREDYGELITGRAFGYSPGPDGALRVVPDLLTAVGSSSIFSTAEDMARWMINYDAATAVEKPAIDLMQTPGKLNDGSSNRYAFGITTGTDPFRKIPFFTSSGGWAGFSSYDAWYPGRGFGIVVLSNSTLPALDAQSAVIKIADIFLGNNQAPSTSSGSKTVPVNIDELVGTYRFNDTSFVRIEKLGSVLTAQLPRGGRRVLDVQSPVSGSISGEDDDEAVSFIRNNTGALTSIEYRGQRGTKIAESVLSSPADLSVYTGYYDSEELGTSWRVVVVNGTLQMQHRHRGTIPLKYLWRDEFSSVDAYFASIDFERDAAGHVRGLLVNGSPRAQNIRFTKR